MASKKRPAFNLDALRDAAGPAPLPRVFEQPAPPVRVDTSDDQKGNVRPSRIATRQIAGHFPPEWSHRLMAVQLRHVERHGDKPSNEQLLAEAMNLLFVAYGFEPIPYISRKKGGSGN